jgi:DNA polymerase-3 subunit alpha
LYSIGKEVGSSVKLLDYVWDVVIHRQVGYSFSVLHSTSYSLIALQELNLVYKYPPIFWNTACLTVNAGAIDENDEWDEIDVPSVVTEDDSDDDDDEEVKKAKSKSTNYGKIATAIGNMQSNGVTIALPDINRAKFSFFPDLDKNEILFGLKGITRISDTMVADIIANRPYVSIKEFIKKLSPTKTQMINLIKAGCFDGIETKPRVELMKEYIESICGKKQKITLQNMNALIENNLLPDELKLQMGVYSLNKYLKDYKK